MTELTEIERRVLAEIDDEEIVRDLAELVAIPSVDGSAAESLVQHWCADRFEGLGMSVDRWDVDLAELVEAPGHPGMEVPRAQLVGCVGLLGPADDEPALALCGHTDVVPPGDRRLWGSDPFDLRHDADGAAWGRGCCDMKGGLAAVLGAVAALRRAEAQLRRPLAVHAVSAEEDGGVGAFATLRRGHVADACLIAEPTAGKVIPANAGSLTFRLVVTGLATHGATRSSGVSAIEKFDVVHQALRTLEEERNREVPTLLAHLDIGFPLSVGKVTAGDWASTVPDRLEAEGRYGVRLGETMDDATTAFEQAVAAACRSDRWLREHPVEVTWPGGRFAPGSLPDGHPLLDQVRDAVDDITGTRPAVVGAPYGSDLRHYAAAGIPTLQYGPGDVRVAHAAGEHVSLAEVYACARVYALLALRVCGLASG